jgi:hypothetical protein
MLPLKLLRGANAKSPYTPGLSASTPRARCKSK